MGLFFKKKYSLRSFGARYFHIQHYSKLTTKSVCISVPITPSKLLGPASSLLASWSSYEGIIWTKIMHTLYLLGILFTIKIMEKNTWHQKSSFRTYLIHMRHLAFTCRKKVYHHHTLTFQLYSLEGMCNLAHPRIPWFENMLCLLKVLKITLHQRDLE